MRLWSIHPRYLDARGLAALWRESLLAQKVLQGETRGYRNHPQLQRFRDLHNPIYAIASYLAEIEKESACRGYHFDSRKIAQGRSRKKIPVNAGQVQYELDHLRRKLWKRDRRTYRKLDLVERPETHPLFVVKPGPVEDWEAIL